MNVSVQMGTLTELSYKAISNISPSTFGPALLMTLLDLTYFSHVSREQITKYLKKKYRLCCWKFFHWRSNHPHTLCMTEFLLVSVTPLSRFSIMIILLVVDNRVGQHAWPPRSSDLNLLVNFVEIFRISGVSSPCVKLGESSRRHIGRLRGPSKYVRDFGAFTVVNVMTLWVLRPYWSWASQILHMKHKTVKPANCLRHLLVSDLYNHSFYSLLSFLETTCMICFGCIWNK